MNAAHPYPRLHRALFWAILILFIGLSVWWIFYIPFDRESVYSAVPPDAVFIGEHEKLAERWEAIGNNPLTQCLLKIGGLDTNEVDKVVNDPEVKKNIRRFASRDTVIAYVPSFGRSRQPAWFIASWVGGQGQILRLALACGVVPGLRKTKAESGRSVWFMDMKTGRSESVLSVAVAQGVLLGCLSPDPAAAQYVADRVDRHAPVVPELRQRLRPAAEAGRQADVLDRGWLDWSFVSGKPGPCKVQYGLNAHEQGLSAGWIHGTVPLPSAAPLRATVDFGELAGLVGDAPDMFVVAPFAYVEPLLAETNPAVRITGQFLKDSAAETNAVFVSLSGGDYSGRILGLKVPTVLAGMKIRNADTVLDRIGESVDRLNRECRWGLIVSRAEIERHPAAVLGLNRNDLFASLGADERPALAVATNWLVLGSNLEVLRKILGRSAGGGEARWARGLERARDANAYAWIDLEASNQALKNAIAVYTLSLLVSSRDGRVEGRDQLNNLSGWLDALRSLKTCRLWLQSDPTGFDLQFELGAPP